MKNQSAILAALGASFVSFPAIALADEDGVDQIIVTGSRTPMSINSVGSAVTVITRDDIERRQARYVSDLLRTVPGFSVSHSGVAGAQTQVRVRGAEANHVLVLIDGARANDPATGDEFRWEFLTTANIERIEIVRGPQSALWGSDAVAGVVHIITRSGGTQSGASGYVEAGSLDTLNSALNASLGDDDWSMSFSVERLETDGGNISRTGNEDDNSDATTGSLSASLQASESLAFTFGARVVDSYSQYDNIDFFVTGLPADSDVALETQQQYVQLGSTIGGDNSRIRHHVAARYFDSENKNLTDGIEDVTALSDRMTFAYQADISIGDDVLSLALEREETDFEQRGPVGFGDPNQNQEMDVTSVIADYQARLGENVTLLASARFDENSFFDDALTGRLSLTWNLNDATRFRGNVGTGQKNPTFIELFGYFPGQFVSNPNLKPETSTSFDLGLERQVSDVLNLQLTVFKQDLEDEINGFVFDPVTFLSTAENMSGTSERSGIELATRWDVSDNLGLNANYTYIDSSSENLREVRRPRHSGSVDLDYGFMDNRGRAALTAAYGGTRTDTFFPPWPNPPEVVTLSNHWLLDLTVQFRITDDIRLFARGNNLLDSDYEQVYGYRTPGRAGYAGIEVTFGQ
jgi:vitamin B12 transporter